MVATFPLLGATPSAHMLGRTHAPTGGLAAASARARMMPTGMPPVPGAMPPGAAPAVPAVPGAPPPAAAPGGGFNPAGLMADPLFMMGMGLLSQGPSRTPISPLAGAMGGLQMASQNAALQREQEERAEALRLRREEAERKREARELAAQHAKGTEYEDLARADPDRYWQVVTREEKAPDPFVGTKSVPGVGLVRMGEDGTPEVIVEAKPTTSIKIGDSDKPLGTDSVKWRNADGEAPPPGMTPRQAEAGGFLPQTAEEEEKRKLRAQWEAQTALLEAEITRAEAARDAAREVLDANPGSAEARRAYNEAANAVARAKAGRANPRGEPSGDVARDFAQPGALQRWAEEGIETGIRSLWDTFSGSGSEPAEAPADVPIGVGPTRVSPMENAPVGDVRNRTTEELYMMLGVGGG